MGPGGKALEAPMRGNSVMSPDSPAHENRGAEIAETYYAKRQLGSAGIIRSAELLHELWTRSKNVKMHAIADGFRRQAYIIAQVVGK